MIPLTYPSTLPGPAAAPFRSAERRLKSDDPFETRAVQRDRLGTQQVTFPPFGAAQKEIFEAWWRDTLVYGGAWFASNWPQPQGSIPWARRFMGAPKYQYLAGGYWRVTADFEVRGRGELPTTDDPIDPAIDLLLYFEGAAGTTYFPDSSSHHRNVVVHPSVAVSHTQAQQGAASGLFGGGFLSVSGMSIDNADFRVECRVFPTSTTNGQVIWSFARTPPYFYLSMSVAGGLVGFSFNARNNNATEGTPTHALNAWHEVVVKRAGGNAVEMTVDGGSAIQASTNTTVSISGSDLRIGTENNHALVGADFIGYIDHFMVLKGVSEL